MSMEKNIIFDLLIENSVKLLTSSTTFGEFFCVKNVFTFNDGLLKLKNMD